MTTAMPGDRPVANAHATRSVVMGRNGMIATSQPLASVAGLKTLQDGGNAIDAAVTAAAVLAVVEPSMTGIGGDLFAIVYEAKTGKLHALNASGRSPYAATPEEFMRRHEQQMPASGVLAVTVPGVVDGWAQLLEKFGTASMARTLAPAVDYARGGYPVAEIVSAQWRASEQKLASDAAAAATFLPRGRAPRPGEVFANPRLAATLELIASEGRDAFYSGPIARAIAADLKKRNGLLDERDLAAHAGDWVEPISTSYRGYDVYEMPPNTQGFLVLEMLNILEGFDLKSMGYGSADYIHALVEAKRIAFADRAAYLADPEFVPAAVLAALISKEYAASRRKEIDMSRAAAAFQPGIFGTASAHAHAGAAGRTLSGLDRGDTIYLTAADGDGNFVSLIQSLFSDFGSGVVAGDTGVLLHNRGSGFTLAPGSPNQIGPHKRPLHTLIPAFVMKNGAPWLSFGVMGGDHQAQGHTQVLVNAIDFDMNVQEAGDAGRINHGLGGVQLESGLPDHLISALTDRGHQVTRAIGTYGGYQGIRFEAHSRVLMGGSDMRKDGLAIGW